MPIESITTPEIEAWIGGVDRSAATRTKALVLMHGIFKRAKKVYGLPLNPVAEVEKPPTAQSGDIDVFSVEEVMALIRAAASEQDAAIYPTAALTGLRRASYSRCGGATWISRARSSACGRATPMER